MKTLSPKGRKGVRRGAGFGFAALFAIAAVAGVSALLATSAVYAFTGPSQSSGSGSGLIGTDSYGDVSIGSATPVTGVRLLVVGSTTDSAGIRLR